MGFNGMEKKSHQNKQNERIENWSSVVGERKKLASERQYATIAREPERKLNILYARTECTLNQSGKIAAIKHSINCLNEVN